MNRTHWAVVPALLAVAWLTLAGATVFALARLPTESSPQTTETTAGPPRGEDLPPIFVVASG